MDKFVVDTLLCQGRVYLLDQYQVFRSRSGTLGSLADSSFSTFAATVPIVRPSLECLEDFVISLLFVQVEAVQPSLEINALSVGIGRLELCGGLSLEEDTQWSLWAESGG